MYGMWCFAVVALMVGVVEPRSVQLDLLKLVKNSALSNSGVEANEAHLQNNAVGSETSGDENGAKVGFILFGNLEDLEKYKIKLDNDMFADNDNLNYEIENPVKDSTMDLEAKTKTSEEIKEENDYHQRVGAEEAEEKEKREQNDKSSFKFLDDYEEDEDSEDYENSEENENKSKVGIDIFSEDQYDEYNDKDIEAENDASEEDESEEERFYDEEEKYYEDENKRFRESEDQSGFDRIFEDDK